MVVRHAHLAGAELFSQLSGHRELVGRGVARGLTQAFERQGDSAQVRIFVCAYVLLEPAPELDVVLGSGTENIGDFGVCAFAVAVQRRRHKAGGDAVQLGLRDGVRAAVVVHDLAVLGFHVVKVTLAFGLDQNLDARLVDVVAPAIAVVHAHDGFDVVHHLVPGQELADHAADDRRAAHAAAHLHFEAEFAFGVAKQVQADVMPGGGGAVFQSTADGDFEFTRQKSELGVQRAPLAQDLAEGARVGNLVHRNAGQLVAGDVADAIAAGLDAVHVDAGQQVHHVG